MNENILNISDGLLENLSAEQLAQLKVEVDDLMVRLDNILETCDEALNS